MPENDRRITSLRVHKNIELQNQQQQQPQQP